MKKATFKDWTLTRLEKTFNLKQVFDDDYPLLQNWQNIEFVSLIAPCFVCTNISVVLKIKAHQMLKHLFPC